MVDCPFAAAIKKEIAELLEDLDQLTQQACPVLRKTYGIAVDGALCGEIPLPISPWKTNRQLHSREGKRQANNATLYRVVVVRLIGHEQTKAFAARCMEEGRSKSEIMQCLKRFIAREVFDIVHGRPPVRTAAA